MTLKTLTHINNRPVIVEVGMKTLEVCLEEIQDGKHGKYPYTQAVLDLIDAEELEERLKSIAQSVESGNSADCRIFAVSFGHSINDAMLKRAEAMSEKSVNPYDESNLSDIEREK